MKINDILMLVCLFRQKVPFDLSYKPETRKDEAGMTLTVYAAPKVTVNIDLEIK